MQWIEENGYILYGENAEYTYDISDVEGCKRYCLNYPGMCKSLTFDAEGGVCYVNTVQMDAKPLEFYDYDNTYLEPCEGIFRGR